MAKLTGTNPDQVPTNADLGTMAYQDKDNVNVGSFTSNGIDDNATSTAMTLDASGNLLVGKTASDSSIDGTTVFNSGFLANTVTQGTTDSGAVAQFRRSSTDGDIVTFLKDGNGAGSIKSDLGYLTIGKNTARLLFLDSSPPRIIPRGNSVGVASDGLMDMGDSGSRFRDLYLSGGVYLGGTGAANQLSDYEEGSGNVSVGASVSGSVAIAPGGLYQYTKIGNIVHFQFEFQVTSVSGASGAIRVTLPFTAYRYAAGSLRTYNATFSGTSPFIETVPNHNALYFYSNSSGNVNQAIMSTGYYYGEVTYRVT